MIRLALNPQILDANHLLVFSRHTPRRRKQSDTLVSMVCHRKPVCDQHRPENRIPLEDRIKENGG